MNIDTQKELLLKEKEQLTHDLSALGRALNENGDWVVTSSVPQEEQADDLDRANITEELEENIAVLNVLEKRYAQVGKALLAIENGTYGICEVSGEKISEERLLANPSATTSVENAK